MKVNINYVSTAVAIWMLQFNYFIGMSTYKYTGVGKTFENVCLIVAIIAIIIHYIFDKNVRIKKSSFVLICLLPIMAFYTVAATSGGTMIKMLMFALSFKGISYAASIGAIGFTSNQAKEMQEALRDYTAISVREHGAVQLIQNLAPIKVYEVLDPTLLYTAQDWEKLMCPVAIREPYIFMYAVDNHPMFRKRVYEYCKSRKIQLVTIPFNQSHYKNSDMRYTDRPLYAIGPKQWIWLIKNAEMVFTDSFHGSAFCLQFKKDFWAFEAPCGEEVVAETKRIYSLD